MERFDNFVGSPYFALDKETIGNLAVDIPMEGLELGNLLSETFH